MRAESTMKTDAKRIALSGLLAALAVSVMFLGGVLPFATIAMPVMASLILIPVYIEAGRKWGVLWYLAVAALGLLLCTDKEGPILFVFFGCYPMLHRKIGHLRVRALRWLLKIVYVNASIAAAYSLMIFLFRMDAILKEYRQTGTFLLIALVALANVSFVIYDVLIDRLELYYHVRIRPKLKL